MLNFLPPHINQALEKVGTKNLNEIRIRANKPITVSIGGKYCYLAPYGLTDKAELAIRQSYAEIEAIVLKATDYSIYSVNNQIACGYLTASGGVRIGIAGEYVIEKNSVITIKNITSLNIRIPHEIKGCADLIYNACLKDAPASVLIASLPGIGKTTILRDLARQISNNQKGNVLIIDERAEIASIDKNTSFDIGDFTDVLKFCNKTTAFESAIRSMRPDYIITDELASAPDILAAQRAIYSGVNVAASCHLSGFITNFDKTLFSKYQVFDYYVQLSHSKIGQVDFIYDKNFNLIFGNN